MTSCNAMRAMMLHASPRTLRGEGDDALARHVASCGECARVARRLLRDLEALDEALGSAPPVLDVDALLARAGRAPPRRARDTSQPVAGTVSPPRWRRWAAVALAACVAGLALFVRSRLTTPGVEPARLPILAGAAPAQPAPTVVSAPGRNVAVIPTDNPDITVVWYF